MRCRVYRRGRRWYADYEDHQGNRVRRALPEARTKAHALEIVHDLAFHESRIRRGMAHAVDNSAEVADLVERFLLHLARSDARYDTVLFYRSVLATTVGKWELADGKVWPPRTPAPLAELESLPRHFVPGQMNIETLEQLTEVVLDRYIEANRKRLAVRTLNAQVAALKTMLNWARKASIIRDNPLADRGRVGKPATTRRVLDVEEVQALLAASPEPYGSIWLAFLTTGLRRGELAALTWQVVDLRARTITVLAETSKSKRQRDVPIVPELHERLLAIRSAAQDPLGHVFLNSRNRPWNHNLRHRLRRCLALADITTGDVTLHTLRHTFATHLLLRGANPKVVSELLGHASIQITFDTYGHVMPQDKWDAIAILPFGGTLRAQDRRDASQRIGHQHLTKATA